MVIYDAARTSLLGPVRHPMVGIKGTRLNRALILMRYLERKFHGHSDLESRPNKAFVTGKSAQKLPGGNV